MGHSRVRRLPFDGQAYDATHALLLTTTARLLLDTLIASMPRSISLLGILFPQEI